MQSYAVGASRDPSSLKTPRDQTIRQNNRKGSYPAEENVEAAGSHQEPPATVMPTPHKAFERAHTRSLSRSVCGDPCRRLSPRTAVLLQRSPRSNPSQRRAERLPRCIPPPKRTTIATLRDATLNVGHDPFHERLQQCMRSVEDRHQRDPLSKRVIHDSSHPMYRHIPPSRLEEGQNSLLSTPLPTSMSSPTKSLGSFARTSSSFRVALLLFCHLRVSSFVILPCRPRLQPTSIPMCSTHEM